MKKTVFAIGMGALLMTQAASAHQIWIEKAGKTPTLRFGEFADNLHEKSPGTLDKLPSPKATLIGKNGEKSLTLQKTQDGFTISATPAAGESIVAEENGWPSFESKQDGATKRGIWVPAARYITGFAAQPAKLTLDVVPTGTAGRFQVLFKGQPLPKAKVVAVMESGWEKNAEADEQGNVEFALPWRGTYVLEVQHTDKTAGQRDGQSYDTASYVTSLSLIQAKGAAAPAKPKPAASSH